MCGFVLSNGSFWKFFSKLIKFINFKINLFLNLFKKLLNLFLAMLLLSFDDFSNSKKEDDDDDKIGKLFKEIKQKIVQLMQRLKSWFLKKTSVKPEKKNES